MRISDWSSDVCSSDLPEAEICTGNVFYSTPALTNRAKLSSNGLILAASEEGSRTQWPSTSKCPHFHRPWRQGRLPSGSSKRAIPSPLATRSEEHTSVLQSLMRISYAVFCLNKKT